MAASIALAESGGNPSGTNHNTNGSTDRGLWQINSVHGAQSTYDVGANTRAAISISKNGTTWGPWATYNNGAYKKYLTGADVLSKLGKREKAFLTSPDLEKKLEGLLKGTASMGELEIAKKLQDLGLLKGLKSGKATIEGSSLTETAPSPFGAVSTLVQDAIKVVSFLGSGEGWFRIGKVLGGSILFLIAMNELLKVGGQSAGVSGPVYRAAKTARHVKTTIGE